MVRLIELPISEIPEHVSTKQEWPVNPMENAPRVGTVFDQAEHFPCSFASFEDAALGIPKAPRLARDRTVSPGTQNVNSLDVLRLEPAQDQTTDR
jgi:hypothetical protein